MHFRQWKISISIKISPKFVPKYSVDNNSVLVRITSLRRRGGKTLSEQWWCSVTYVYMSRLRWIIDALRVYFSVSSFTPRSDSAVYSINDKSQSHCWLQTCLENVDRGTAKDIWWPFRLLYVNVRFGVIKNWYISAAIPRLKQKIFKRYIIDMDVYNSTVLWNLSQKIAIFLWSSVILCAVSEYIRTNIGVRAWKCPHHSAS